MAIEDDLTSNQRDFLRKYIGGVSSQSGVNFVMMSADGRIGYHNEDTGCHANICGLYYATQGYEYIVNSSYLYGASKDVRDLQLWVYKDSPWAKAGLWLNSSFESVEEYGFITDTRQPSALVGSACMATKMVREYGMEALKSGMFTRMLSEGVHPMLALGLLSSISTFPAPRDQWSYSLGGRSSQFPFTVNTGQMKNRKSCFFSEGIAKSILDGTETELYASSGAPYFFTLGYYTGSRNVWSPDGDVFFKPVLIFDKRVSDSNPTIETEPRPVMNNPFRPSFQRNGGETGVIQINGARVSSIAGNTSFRITCKESEFSSVIKTWLERSKPLLK